MKKALPFGLIVLTLLSACKENSEADKTAVSIIDAPNVVISEERRSNQKSLEDSASGQMLDLFGLDGDDFNDLFKVDSLESEMKILLTEEAFKRMLVSDDFSEEELDDLLKAYKQKDSLDAQLLIAQKNGATKAEMKAMMEEHKETLKQITGNPDQIDQLYSMLDSKRVDNALNTIGKDPISKEQAQVRRKLDLGDASFVEEKLTSFSLYGETKRKETMIALKAAPKAKSDSIVATHFGVSKEEVDLLKTLPPTPKLFAENEAIAMRDYQVNTSISNHIASGNASKKFETIVKKFSEKQKRQATLFLKNASKAREDFYKLNPGWHGEDEASGITYSDSRNKLIYLPLGTLSFADEVISHDTGKNDTGSNKQGAIGIPDMMDNQFRNADPKVCNLGLSGVLTLSFLDNAITNVNGPDLYVFELGAVEPTNLELSKDGKEWINVGKIDGGTAFVDIEAYVKPGETYTYVRLTDLESQSALPGADVDAIAAIGGAIRLNVDSSVLFDTGAYNLKESATPELEKLVEKIALYPSGKIVIEGHTDSDGSPVSNKTLSLKRAEIVSAFLKNKLGDTFTFKQKGYGESQPIAPNDTPENKAKNRRVELLVIPQNNN